MGTAIRPTGEGMGMAQDQRELRDEMASWPPAAPRLRAVACLGGVSLERGVPTGEIHDYIQEPENVVWVDVQDPGPVGAGHADRRVRPPPPGAGGRCPRPAPSEGGRVQGLLAARNVRGRVPGAEAKEPADHRGGPVHRPELSWSPSTGVGVPALEAGVGAGRAAGRGCARVSASSSTRCWTPSSIPSPRSSADIEEEIEETEFAVFTRSDEESVRSLLRLKRTLASLRRELHPLRSVFQVLLRRDHPVLPGQHGALHLREVNDHVLRMLDTLDAEREMAAAAMDASLAIGSHRLNKTMKGWPSSRSPIAVVGSVFGAYGMNFEVAAAGLGSLGVLASSPRHDRPGRGGPLPWLVARVVLSVREIGHFGMERFALRHTWWPLSSLLSGALS